MSAVDITRAMLADFDSMKCGSVFDPTEVDYLDNETSERNPLKKGTIFDWYITQSVILEPLLIFNTMAKPCVAPCKQNG